MIAKPKTNTTKVREAYQALSLTMQTFRTGEVVEYTGIDATTVAKIRRDLVKRGEIDPERWVRTVGAPPRLPRFHGTLSKSKRYRSLAEAYKVLAKKGKPFDSNKIAEQSGLTLRYAQQMRSRMLQQKRIDPELWILARDAQAAADFHAECERALDVLDAACRQQDMQVSTYVVLKLGRCKPLVARIRRHLLETDQIIEADWPLRRKLIRAVKPTAAATDPAEDTSYRPSLTEIWRECAVIRAENLAAGRIQSSGWEARMPKVGRVYHDGRIRALRGTMD